MAGPTVAARGQRAADGEQLVERAGSNRMSGLATTAQPVGAASAQRAGEQPRALAAGP
jgi:hypothetical protein